MLTLIISSAFKGSKSEFAKALFICLLIDSLVVICCLPSCSEPVKAVDARDYQIELANDTVKLFDANRLVGEYIYNDSVNKPVLDSLIVADNL